MNSMGNRQGMAFSLILDPESFRDLRGKFCFRVESEQKLNPFKCHVLPVIYREGFLNHV